MAIVLLHAEGRLATYLNYPHHASQRQLNITLIFV